MHDQKRKLPQDDDSAKKVKRDPSSNNPAPMQTDAGQNARITRSKQQQKTAALKPCIEFLEQVSKSLEQRSGPLSLPAKQTLDQLKSKTVINTQNIEKKYLTFTLHAASRFGKVEVIKALTELGANLGATLLPSGHTALHIAAEFGKAEVIKALIELKSDLNLNARTNIGSTALHIAATNGHANAIKALCEAKADLLDAKTNQGFTALHLAIECVKAQAVKLLLAKDANIQTKTALGYSPLDMSFVPNPIANATCLSQKSTTTYVLIARGALTDECKENTKAKIKELLSGQNPESLPLLDMAQYALAVSKYTKSEYGKTHQLDQVVIDKTIAAISKPGEKLKHADVQELQVLKYCINKWNIDSQGQNQVAEALKSMQEAAHLQAMKLIVTRKVPTAGVLLQEIIGYNKPHEVDKLPKGILTAFNERLHPVVGPDADSDEIQPPQKQIDMVGESEVAGELGAEPMDCSQ